MMVQNILSLFLSISVQYRPRPNSDWQSQGRSANSQVNRQVCLVSACFKIEYRGRALGDLGIFFGRTPEHAMRCHAK
jgi:hypothetical protein